MFSLEHIMEALVEYGFSEVFPLISHSFRQHIGSLDRFSLSGLARLPLFFTRNIRNPQRKTFIWAGYPFKQDVAHAKSKNPKMRSFSIFCGTKCLSHISRKEFLKLWNKILDPISCLSSVLCQIFEISSNYFFFDTFPTCDHWRAIYPIITKFVVVSFSSLLVREISSH